MKVLGALFLASAIVAVCNGGYPKIRAIFVDPKVYSNRFLSGRYDINEQYSFNKNISLDAVIVPTRILSEYSNDSYVETYNIIVEAADDLGDAGYREDVGFGYFNGTVEPGTSITVPIRSLSDPEESVIAVPTRNGEVLRYVIYLQYGMMAGPYYPEFANRSVDFLDIFSRTPLSYGMIVGLEYSHP